MFSLKIASTVLSNTMNSTNNTMQPSDIEKIIKDGTLSLALPLLEDTKAVLRSANKVLSDLKAQKKPTSGYAPPVKKKTEEQLLLGTLWSDYRNELTKMCEDVYAKEIGSYNFLPHHRTEIKNKVITQIAKDLEELLRSTKERVHFSKPKHAKRISTVNPVRTSPSGTLSSLTQTAPKESEEETHEWDRRREVLKMKHLKQLEDLPDHQDKEEPPAKPITHGNMTRDPSTLTLDPCNFFNLGALGELPMHYPCPYTDDSEGGDFETGD